MTDDDLAAIEANVAMCAERDCPCCQDIGTPLVAEVRRLRGEVEECPYKAYHP